MTELPYANSSLNSSVGISVDDVDANNSVSNPEESDPFCLAGRRSSSSMVFCHLNVQNLLPKMDECRKFIQDTTSPLIFGMSETWLTENVADGEVAVDVYTLYRRDRKN